MTRVRRWLGLNGDPVTARYRYAFLFFSALMVAISVGLGVVVHTHSADDQRRDCLMVAGVIASGPRDPAPLVGLGARFGCPGMSASRAGARGLRG